MNATLCIELAKDADVMPSDFDAESKGSGSDAYHSENALAEVPRNLAAFDNLVSQCMLGAQVSDWLSIWNPPAIPLVTLAIADNDRRDVSEATLESLEPPAKKHYAGQTTQGLNDRAISV